jgi:hypothetical protein
MEIVFREGVRVVGERGWEGGWEEEMGVNIAPNPVTATKLDSTSRMFQMQFWYFIEFLPVRERDPSMYKNVRSLKLLPVMSEEKTGHFYICSRHTRSQIPDPFFSSIPKVCHTGDHASRLWLADIRSSENAVPEAVTKLLLLAERDV